jgi:predicted nucleic acid-binding protein
VLQEFYNAVTRKLARPMTLDDAESAVRLLARLTVVPCDGELVVSAISVHRRYRLSLWDALVVQAAIAGGCDRLLTEDLQSGMRFGNLEVEDPFSP